MKVLVCHQKVMLQPLGYHCHLTWTSFGKTRLTVKLVVSVSGWSISVQFWVLKMLILLFLAVAIKYAQYLFAVCQLLI